MSTASAFHYGRICRIKATNRLVRITAVAGAAGLIGVRSASMGLKRFIYFRNELEPCDHPASVDGTLLDQVQECGVDYPELGPLMQAVASEIISLREDLATAESFCDVASIAAN